MPIGTSDGKTYEDEWEMTTQENRGVVDKLLGLSGERYQLWPEKALRGVADAFMKGFTLPGDVSQGKIDPMSESSIGRAAELAEALVFGPMPIARKVVDGTLGSFGGIASKKVSKVDHDNAVRLTEMGVDPDTVWQKTGFFRGADDHFRYEISDAKANLKSGKASIKEGSQGEGWTSAGSMDTITLNEKTKLGDVLHHPELFDAYPHLKDIDVVPYAGKDFAGAYAHDRNMILMGPDLSPDQFLRTLMHETQHAIQRYEGFARGGNPRMFSSPEFENAAAMLEHRISGFEDKLARQGYDVQSLRGAIEAEQSGLLNKANIPADVKKSINNYLEMTKQTGVYDEYRLFIEAEKKVKAAKDSHVENYKRLKGEVESRNVEDRLDMSDQERFLRNPISTEDRPRFVQIDADKVK